MSEKIKLIWDFRGEDALKTAEHHAVHLRQFATKEKIEGDAGVETISDSHAIAFIVVNQANMIDVRDALIPHRGTLVKE